MDSCRNIRVLKADKYRDYCYECENKPEILAVTKWSSVTQTEYLKLLEAINKANLNPSGKWRYFIVEEIQDTEEIFESAKEFVASQEKKQKQREQEEARKKKERAAKAQERKLKQLEKLKKELGQ